jgi:hypothetical protein
MEGWIFVYRSIDRVAGNEPAASRAEKLAARNDARTGITRDQADAALQSRIHEVEQHLDS